MSCCTEPCDDPRCQVCTTTARGFPQPVFKDQERKMLNPTRGGQPKMAGERARAGTSSPSRRDPRKKTRR